MRLSVFPYWALSLRAVNRGGLLRIGVRGRRPFCLPPETLTLLLVRGRTTRANTGVPGERGSVRELKARLARSWRTC